MHLPVNLCPVDRTLGRAAKSPSLARKAGDTGSTARSAGAGPRRNPTIEYDRRKLRQKYHGIIGGGRLPIHKFNGHTARESLHSLLIQDVVCNDEVPSFLQNRGDRVDVNLRYGILILSNGAINEYQSLTLKLFLFTRLISTCMNNFNVVRIASSTESYLSLYHKNTIFKYIWTGGVHCLTSPPPGACLRGNQFHPIAE